MSRVRLSFVTLLLFAGCDGDPAADAAAPPPDAPPAVCETVPPPFETGDATGHPEPLGAAAGQARAGRVAEAQLPEDPTGLAVWAPGDFVLATDRVALLIEDVGASDLYDPFGGRPVGIASVEDGRLVRAADYNEILFGFGPYLVATERVTVLADGSDGGPAIVRASGPLRRLEFLGDLLTAFAGGEDYGGLPAAMDYELRPGSDAIEVYVSVAPPTPAAIRVPFLVQGILQRYRMPIWTPGGGFTVPTSAFPMAAFVADEATSYAWLAAEGAQLTPILDTSGVLALSAGSRVVARGCERSRFHLGTFVIGGPGLGGLQGALAHHRGETLRTVRGVVVDASGAPAPEIRVHARRADGSHFARVMPAADGTFELAVPDEEVSFEGYAPGAPRVGPVTVPAGTGAVRLERPATGAVHVEVTDAASGVRLPARVQLLPAGGAPEIPADTGERQLSRGRSHIEFAMPGALDLVAAPGAYDVVVSRGYEYELVRESVNVREGETLTVSAALDRVVDTTGVMCADYHIHTHRSPDSTDSPERKLTALIADGLEIPIRSDHEWVNDFQPVIERMGLADWAFGVGGEELTTFAWGHFNVFPLVEDRSLPSGGAIPWVGRLPPAVFADVRARREQPVLIINHPRSGGRFGGYFNAAGLDRATGVGVNTDHWDEEFTLVEVFNDESFEEARDSTVADWFGLLRGGRRVFAVGSSDSHNVDGSPVGYPRTCLLLDTDDPRSLTPNRVRDVTAAGHSTISGGIYLTVSGPGEVGPGETARGVGASASFDVTVQAASWIREVGALEVIVDGVTVEMIPLGEPDPLEPVVRLRASGITVPVDARGSWVVFHVGSERAMDEIHPGRRPFAVSNPVFLER